MQEAAHCGKQTEQADSIEVTKVLRDHLDSAVQCRGCGWSVWTADPGLLSPSWPLFS